MLPMLPAVVENCAECTYPIPEELSTGLLFVGECVASSLPYTLSQVLDMIFLAPLIFPFTVFLFIVEDLKHVFKHNSNNHQSPTTVINLTHALHKLLCLDNFSINYDLMFWCSYCHDLSGGNVVGIPFIFIVQVLLSSKKWGPPPFIPSNIFIQGKPGCHTTEWNTTNVIILQYIHNTMTHVLTDILYLCCIKLYDFH
jgi:hypothetical protein